MSIAVLKQKLKLAVLWVEVHLLPLNVVLLTLRSGYFLLIASITISIFCQVSSHW